MNPHHASETGAAKPRFPFPSLPRGWFVVALSEDLGPGEILPMHYFGRDLIAFRTESGRAHVTDAYCPHLGAHFAHGGKVEGERLRCPFHGWCFEGSGACVEVPYAERIPPKARLDSWPVLEQDGCIHVFHDPARGPAHDRAGSEPWPLPVLGDEGWTPGKSIHWRGLTTHAQEVFENTVDTAHVGPVHDGIGARIIGEPVRDGPTMRINIEFQAPGDVVDMPDTINDVHLEVTMRGLGWVLVHTHVRNVDVWARQRIYATPVDEQTIDIRGIVQVRPTDDPEFTAELAEIFYRAYVEDFARDFPIWENKRYLVRPALAKGDGPVGIYRRWCSQFYVDAGRDAGPDPTPREPRQSPQARGPGLLSRLVSRPDRLLRVLSPARERVVGVASSLLDRAGLPLPWTEERAAREGEAGGGEAQAEPGEPADPGTKRAGARAREAHLPVTSVDEYVETLPRRFVPAAAKGIDEVYQWQLGGDRPRTFHAIVRDQTIEVVEGPHPGPSVRLEIDGDLYLKVVNGEVDGMRVFASGKGKVRGSIKTAMGMQKLFPY